MKLDDLIKALATEGPPLHVRALTRILELRLAGYGMRPIADTLNQEGYKGRLGGTWHYVSVRRQLEGLGLGTSSPNTCWCRLRKEEDPPEIGSTWKGHFRANLEVEGVVEDLKGRKVLVRPNDWVFPEIPPKRSKRWEEKVLG